MKNSMNLVWPVRVCIPSLTLASLESRSGTHTLRGQTKFFVFILVFAALVVSGFAKGYATLSIRHHKIVAEIARTPEEWEHGLMYRKRLSKNHGMLFIFKTSEVRNFWMKNTFIPLDIAFLDEKGKILTLKTMKPLSPDLVSSEKPCLYALEVNAGLLKQIHASIGDQVSGIKERGQVHFQIFHCLSVFHPLGDKFHKVIISKGHFLNGPVPYFDE